MTGVRRAPRAGPGTTPAVVLVGPVPPPTHGQAVANEALMTGRYDRMRVVPVPTRFSAGIDDVGRARLGKLVPLVRTVWRVWMARWRDGARAIVYSIGFTNRTAVFRDIALLLSTRWCFPTVVLHVHTLGSEQVIDGLGPTAARLARRAYGRTAAVIQLDPHAEQPEPLFGTERCYFLANGITAPPPPAGDAGDAAVGGVEQRPLRVLFLGNLYRSKGPGVLLDASERLVEQGIDVEVVLAGGSPEAEFASSLRRRSRSGPLAGRVELVGVLGDDDKWRALHRCDLLCFPTAYPGEGLPMVVIEAMAAGKPVVATAWRSIPALVVDGETGLLVAPGDVSALADALARLANDPALRQAMGSAGRRRYETAFDVSIFRQRFEEILCDVLPC